MEGGGDRSTESVGVGDIRGTKEGWHLTAQSDGMKLGDESLAGSITTSSVILYPLIYDAETNKYVIQGTDLLDPVSKPEVINAKTWSLLWVVKLFFWGMPQQEKGKGYGILKCLVPL